MNASISARKIGANLWEVQPQFNFQKLDGDDDDIHQRRRRHHSFEKEVLIGPDQLPDNKSQPCEDFDHLLKVLHRISVLEEQHSHDSVLIKSLKRDLDISRAQIKTLVEERKRDHQEIQELKRLTQERKGKVVQSTKDELLEVKSMFMREKKTRVLLESLCDEFAKGIRDYEQKVRILQQNRDQIVSRNKADELILHVSEAWLDERIQMNGDFAEKTSISDNLFCEIEMFLEAKKKQLCGILGEPSLQLGSRLIDPFPGPTEPSLRSMSRMTDQDPGFTEPSSQPMSRMVQAPKVVEPSTRPTHVGVKANTLMAKLVEARLESMFSKSRRVRR